MKLLKSMQGNIKSREEWLTESQKAAELVMYLPEEIRDLNGDGDMTGDKLTITFHEVSNSEVNLDELLRREGFPKKDTQHSSYSTTFSVIYEGKLITGNEVRFTVTLKEAPKNCKLVAYEDVVTRYKMECEDEKENK